MDNVENITAELVEKEIVSIDLIEKELFSVELYTVDFTKGKTYVRSLLVFNETPTPSAEVRASGLPFTLINTYDSGTLQIFLNGQKLDKSDVTEITDKTFSISIDTLITDLIEVCYFKGD